LRATLILLAFNQENFIREAALSCLAQDCEPIEIIFSDDASSDGTFEILRQIAGAYQGPHKVVVRQNSCNLGIGGHYNLLADLACGLLIVTAAGDDISEPYRVRKLLQAWDSKNGEPDLVSSYLTRMRLDGSLVDTIRVDDLSTWHSPELWMAKRPFVIGAAHAFTKRLHQKFGPFSEQLSFEDQVMSLRASCLGGGVVVTESLLRYRDGGVSTRAVSITTPMARMKALVRRHSQQIAMYTQIHADLVCVQKEHLFSRKYVWRLSRSIVFLEMLAARNLTERWQVLRKHILVNPAACIASIQSFCIVSSYKPEIRPHTRPK
jgi:glycosyltransferase involved in cell wall biosynthesis